MADLAVHRTLSKGFTGIFGTNFWKPMRDQRIQRFNEEMHLAKVLGQEQLEQKVANSFRQIC